MKALVYEGPGRKHLVERPRPSCRTEEALVPLSDILPTGFECGVLSGRVQVGPSIAPVGSGPIGRAAGTKTLKVIIEA
jgi:threonine dehydrogenase-like Zn-dependent dehydrogenase